MLLAIADVSRSKLEKVRGRQAQGSSGGLAREQTRRGKGGYLGLRVNAGQKCREVLLA